MIGHSIIDVHASHNMPMTGDAQECCAVPHDAADAQAAALDHHQMDPVILEFIKTLLLFVIVATALFFARTSIIRHLFLKNYAVHWDRSISYVALYLQRLFSKGMLHPKTW